MKSIIAAFAITAITTAAFAAGPTFAEADTNADGVVNLEEAKVALPDMPEDQIVAADADNSGDLSQEEYEVLTAG